MNNMKDYRKLIKEGFVFTDQVFSYFDTENSKNAFWSVINCEYDTGIEPETRFWNPGDNPKDIILSLIHISEPTRRS